MQKLYILKNVLLAVPLIMFLQSCKKESPLSVDKRSKLPTVTVNEARTWVKNNKPTLSIGNENWKKATIVESANNEKGNKLLRVPINETLLNDKTWIIRDLIFQKDSLGQVVCDVYKIIPNADYISKKTGKNRSAVFKREFIDNNDFTGQILLFTIDNQLIRGRKYVNGKLEFELEKKRRRNYGALMSGNPTSTELGAPETCNDPNDGCKNEKGGGGDYSWVNQLEEVNITAPAKPNPGYTPPSYFGGNIPPGDIYNVSKPGGGGASGGTDGTIQAKNNEFADKIDDAKLKDCFKRVLQQLKNMDRACLPNLVTVFSGTTPGYNWKMVDGTLGADENAVTKSAYDKVSGIATTTFDSDKFRGSSDLAIAKTILHESVHAYLITYFGIDPLAAQKTYSEYLEDYNTTAHYDMNAAQHNEIVRNFVGSVAGNLITYGKNQGYNLPDQFYYDLSWGGLQKTSAFKNFSPDVQKRILNVIKIEQSGIDVDGNQSKPKGNTSGGC
ncbi:hypothetical protein HDE69_000575 [Pedobacter cryoconitis]|uniref:SprT-like family protein n=1 Tax=Pedobacter cryoconitis TaxID=188932 RepID=A0A7W9DIB6_9SPHI|nr:hypothetical protein [Pedobacter cryoconitis]MBB5619539.1 hypothetical protein [Pedobacter cryoconitis]